MSGSWWLDKLKTGLWQTKLPRPSKHLLGLDLLHIQNIEVHNIKLHDL